MKSIEVDLRNENRKYRIPLSSLKKTARQILKTLGRKRVVLSVVLVSDRKIRSLNRRYLRHNRPTDVIAFPYGHMTVRATRRGGPTFLGDIVISLDTTKRQARLYGNSFRYELAFYLCHGILHLLGYEDHTKKERLRMERKQKQILKKIGVQ